MERCRWKVSGHRDLFAGSRVSKFLEMYHHNFSLIMKVVYAFSSGRMLLGKEIEGSNEQALYE